MKKFGHFQRMLSWEQAYICYVNIRVSCILQNKVSAFLAFCEFKGNLQLMHGREQHHNGFFNIFSDIANFFHSFSVTDKQAYEAATKIVSKLRLKLFPLIKCNKMQIMVFFVLLKKTYFISNPFIWMILICFVMVVFPDSPVPANPTNQVNAS